MDTIITPFLGLYTRYMFFKLIGKKKSKAYLSGDGNPLKESEQYVFNVIVGTPILALIILCVVYVVYTLF